MWNPDKKQKVLIVDDEPTNIKILNEIVEPYATVFFALDAETALPLIISKQPDLILLDIVMPGMDGYELIRKLKGDPLTEKIPVIFVTEKREEDEEIKGLNLGAIDYITKPLSAPIVAVRVRNHLELKRARDLLETLSSIDGLTGIPNRRFFNQALELEWKKAMRIKMPVSLIMLDIDHFKEYNDEFGHLAGDEALMSISKVLHASAARASDLAARYGGEEFAIILPGLTLEKVFFFSRKLQSNLLQLNKNNPKLSRRRAITLSFGIACRTPVPGEDPNILIQAADEMLYKAKQGGRNRIEPCLTENRDFEI